MRRALREALHIDDARRPGARVTRADRGEPFPRRGGRSAAGALGVVTIAIAASCTVEPTPDLPPPVARATKTFLLLADGTTDVDVDLTVTFPAAPSTRHYTLSAAELVGEDAPAWTVEVDRGELAQPVTFPGAHDEVDRTLSMHAHAALLGGVVPDLEVALTFVGDGATYTVTPTNFGDLYENGPCPPDDPSSVPGPLGGALVWKAETLDHLVDDVLSIVADETGRTWMVGGWGALVGVDGARIFDVTDGVVTRIVETRSTRTTVAPGSGNGPIALVLGPHPPIGKPVLTVTAYDVDLQRRWEHVLAGASGVGGVIEDDTVVATSGGRVLVGAFVYPPLTIDGAVATMNNEVGTLAVLFDEATGALVDSSDAFRLRDAVGIGGGAFAVITVDASGTPLVVVLEPDLSVRWTRPLEKEGASVASLGGGDVWVGDVEAVTHYAPDGAVVATIPTKATGSIAPLADGGVLVGTKDGVALARPDGTWIVSGFEPAVAPFCAWSGAWVVGQAPGGAVVAARKQLTADVASQGKGVAARVAIE